MNIKKIIAAMALVAGLAVGSNAHAAGPLYLGGKVGFMDSGYSGFDPAFAIGVYGGYNLLGPDSAIAANLGGGRLAVEGEVNFTLLDGDAGAYGDWGITTLAAYGAYIYPLTESISFKAKGGISHQDFKVDRGGSEASDGTSLAFGVGAGFKLGGGTLDAEVTLMEDMNYWSVGYNWRF
ncbi:MAG: hypothetical protein AMJ84_04125 [Acidithiobacillales bacterium SM23_46]|jgi:hypothetical protein|nr:MAG: hypothetical protein AMJ84_04125 [Acidithiobacillales bacterium SM23_46]KPL27617.1 MAG: hypothetical protein AMJ72_07800 [Acidithiobacillales bacterium SM1_46]